MNELIEVNLISLRYDWGGEIKKRSPLWNHAQKYLREEMFGNFTVADYLKDLETRAVVKL